MRIRKRSILKVLCLWAAHWVNGTLTFCAKTSEEWFGIQITWRDWTQEKFISSALNETDEPFKSGKTVISPLYFIDFTDQFTQKSFTAQLKYNERLRTCPKHCWKTSNVINSRGFCLQRTGIDIFFLKWHVYSKSEHKCYISWHLYL